MDTSAVTRVVVIDHRASAVNPGVVVELRDCRIDVALQDNMRTLKIFVVDDSPCR